MFCEVVIGFSNQFHLISHSMLTAAQHGIHECWNRLTAPKAPRCTCWKISVVHIHVIVALAHVLSQCYNVSYVTKSYNCSAENSARTTFNTTALCSIFCWSSDEWTAIQQTIQFPSKFDTNAEYFAEFFTVSPLTRYRWSEQEQRGHIEANPSHRRLQQRNTLHCEYHCKYETVNILGNTWNSEVNYRLARGE